MNVQLRVLIAGVLLALLEPAGAATCQTVAAARWMLGDWVTGDEDSVFHESWIELGPQTFEGSSSERSLADGKILGSESLRLVEMAGGVYYIAKVAHNQLPVAFALTECDGERLVFENPAHDSPRRLEYRHATDGRMAVTVSDDKFQGFTLSFERDNAVVDRGAPVLAAEDARFSAMIGADAARLWLWLADDLQYVHSNGDVENRRQFVDSIVSGERRYLQISPVERQVIPLGQQSALVRGRGRFQVVLRGTPLDLDLRYLAIYDLGSDGHWRLRSWQSLRLPQKPG